MSRRSLPERPSLDHLKHEAKALLKALRAIDPSTKLTTAQRQLARDYGFPTWAALRNHVRSLHSTGPEAVDRVLRCIQDQDLDGAMRILAEHPAALWSVHVKASFGLATEVKAMLASQPQLVNQKAGDPAATPLLYACLTPFLRDPARHLSGELTVRELLAAGADPNTVDGHYGVSALYGVTGLHNAPRIARVLLEAGANPTDGESVFHAAESFHQEALELLWEFGVQLNFVGEWGNTALCFVLLWHDLGREERAARGVEWLLSHGADPNIPSGKEREDALQVAARRGQPVSIVRSLLAHGGNVNARRGDGATAWRLAKRGGHDDIASLLEEAGAAREDLSAADELLAACGRGDVDTARRLASRGLIESLPPSDRAMLNEAAREGRAATVDACIAAGFNVNDQNDRGALPVHEAAISGYAGIVNALVAAGSDLTVRDPEHNATPLGWAIFGADHVANPEGDYEATIRALLAFGAKGAETEGEPRHPGARDALGLSPT